MLTSGPRCPTPSVREPPFRVSWAGPALPEASSRLGSLRFPLLPSGLGLSSLCPAPAPSSHHEKYSNSLKDHDSSVHDFHWREESIVTRVWSQPVTLTVRTGVTLQDGSHSDELVGLPAVFRSHLWTSGTRVPRTRSSGVRLDTHRKSFLRPLCLETQTGNPAPGGNLHRAP